MRWVSMFPHVCSNIKKRLELKNPPGGCFPIIEHEAFAFFPGMGLISPLKPPEKPPKNYLEFTRLFFKFCRNAIIFRREALVVTRRVKISLQPGTFSPL